MKMAKVCPSALPLELLPQPENLQRASFERPKGKCVWCKVSFIRASNMLRPKNIRPHKPYVWCKEQSSNMVQPSSLWVPQNKIILIPHNIIKIICGQPYHPHCRQHYHHHNLHRQYDPHPHNIIIIIIFSECCAANLTLAAINKVSGRNQAGTSFCGHLAEKIVF